MKINFYRGSRRLSGILGSYYLLPSLKLQPYTNGFELVIWFIRHYVSIRITWNK